MTTAARVGQEKHPKKISKQLNYGTAGFRSRFVHKLIFFCAPHPMFPDLKTFILFIKRNTVNISNLLVICWH